MYGNEDKQYHKENTDCHGRDNLPVLLPSSKMGEPLMQTQTKNNIFSWSSNTALSQTYPRYKPMALLVTSLFTSKVSKTRPSHHEPFHLYFLQPPKLGHVQPSSLRDKSCMDIKEKEPSKSRLRTFFMQKLHIQTTLSCMVHFFQLQNSLSCMFGNRTNKKSIHSQLGKIKHFVFPRFPLS